MFKASAIPGIAIGFIMGVCLIMIMIPALFPSGKKLEKALITSDIITYVIIDGQPTMILEDERFRNIIKSFNGWGISSKNIVSRQSIGPRKNNSLTTGQFVYETKKKVWDVIYHLNVSLDNFVLWKYKKKLTNLMGDILLCANFHTADPRWRDDKKMVAFIEKDSVMYMFYISKMSKIYITKFDKGGDFYNADITQSLTL